MTLFLIIKKNIELGGDGELKKVELDTSYVTKIDAMDLIINVLREHEKTLDELVERMEEILGRLEALKYDLL